MSVRVLIVDPQPFFCEALAVALADEGIVVTAAVTDELEAERIVERDQPDVLLTEIDLASGSGINLVRRVGDRTRALVLTRKHEGEVILDAVAAGAVGCLSHDLEPRTLAAMIARAADGRFVIAEERLHEALRRASASPDAGAGSQLSLLTQREREVLNLLASGLDNAAIGRRLHLSANTVRTHVGKILRKLDVHSRADAARVALQAAEIDGDSEVLRIRGPDLGTH